MSTATTTDTLTFDIDSRVKAKALKQFENMDMDFSFVMSNLITHAVKAKDWLWAFRNEKPLTREQADKELIWALKHGKRFNPGEDVLVDLLKK